MLNHVTFPPHEVFFKHTIEQNTVSYKIVHIKILKICKEDGDYLCGMAM